MGYDIRWDGNMMISKLKKCFYYMKEKVWPTEPSDTDSVPVQDTREASSVDTVDPYLEKLLKQRKEKNKKNGHE